MLRGPNDVIRAQEALHRSSTRAPDRIGEGSEVASRHHNPSRFVLAHVDDDTETLLGVLLLRHQHGPAHRECPDRRLPNGAPRQTRGSTSVDTVRCLRRASNGSDQNTESAPASNAQEPLKSESTFPSTMLELANHQPDRRSYT